MNHIFEIARTNSASTVTGRYLPTAKNVMVKEFYAGFGFQEVDVPSEGGTSWEMRVSEYVPRTVHIEREAGPQH